jgi:hypothetical protein
MIDIISRHAKISPHSPKRPYPLVRCTAFGWPGVVPLPPPHIGAMLACEGGEREASLGIVAADKPYSRPDRRCCPPHRLGMLLQACCTAAKTGLSGGNNAYDQVTPGAVASIETVRRSPGNGSIFRDPFLCL